MKIYFISGIPGSGKSTVADALAKKLSETHVVSTDDVRAIAQRYVPKEECPILHTSSVLSHAFVSEDPANWGIKKFAPKAKEDELTIWGFQNPS